MSPETRKEVLVEYPLDVVYDTLIYLFPVKSYKLEDNDDASHTVKVYDSSNHAFVMFIRAVSNTPNTTVVYFSADYPSALFDIGSGGKTAIYVVLEELLNELGKKPKPENVESESKNGHFEIADPKTFVNPLRQETRTGTVVLGYVFCILSFLAPVFMVFYPDKQSTTMALVLIAGVFAWCFALTVACLLQLSLNSKPKMHGRIQTILAGLVFVVLGFLIHPALAIVGIAAILIIIAYFSKRDKSE